MDNLLVFLVVNTSIDDKADHVDRVRNLLPQPTLPVFCHSRDSACYTFPDYDYDFEVDNDLRRELNWFKYWAICEGGNVFACKYPSLDPAIRALGKKPANDREAFLVIRKKRRKRKPR